MSAACFNCGRAADPSELDADGNHPACVRPTMDVLLATIHGTLSKQAATVPDAKALAALHADAPAMLATLVRQMAGNLTQIVDSLIDIAVDAARNNTNKTGANE